MSINAWPSMSYPCFVQMLNKIPHPRSAERREPSLHALRVAVTVFFALDGYLFASWAVRVPAVKAQVGASPAALGLAQLGLAMAAFGVAYGALNVAMNSVAVDLVAALRRPVMPSFHAAWSFGGLAGASAGGLLAPHLSPLAHFSLACLLGLAVTAVC